MAKRLPVLIGIAGGSGSGKTHLAHFLRDAAGPTQIAVISMDQYFRSDHGVDPAGINFDHPSHLDFRQMLRDLRMLKRGKPVQVPTYDFLNMLQTPAARLIEPLPVILVEGLFVLAEPAVRMFDLTCFLDVPADERLLGRILRDRTERGSDMDEILDRYQRFVRPSYEIFVAPTSENADIWVQYTFRRAFFSQFLGHLIKDYLDEKLDLKDLLARTKRDVFHPGFRPERGTMPYSTSIFRLAKAFAEVKYPKLEDPRLP